MFIKIK